MTHRLKPKVLRLYNNMDNLEDLLYVQHLRSALTILDEILTEYELNDLAFTVRYTMFWLQWVTLERAFYRILKSLRKYRFSNK